MVRGIMSAGNAPRDAQPSARFVNFFELDIAKRITLRKRMSK